MGKLLTKWLSSLILWGVMGSSLAGSGWAFIPFWSVDIPGKDMYTLYVSNLSNTPIWVTITLKDKDGVDYNEDSDVHTQFTTQVFAGDPMSSEGGILWPWHTGELAIDGNRTAKRWGYGWISYQSWNEESTAVRARAYQQHFNEVGGVPIVASESHVEINGGNPF